jgi:hypothetical protein
MMYKVSPTNELVEKVSDAAGAAMVARGMKAGWRVLPIVESTTATGAYAETVETLAGDQVNRVTQDLTGAALTAAKSAASTADMGGPAGRLLNDVHNALYMLARVDTPALTKAQFATALDSFKAGANGITLAQTLQRMKDVA